MGVVTAILYAIVVLIAFLLIGLVLIQPSKGGGFGAAFGGVGEGVFGAQTLSHLSKLTIVLMSVFFALTLVLAVLSGHRQKAKSLVESEPAVSSVVVKTDDGAKTAEAPVDAVPAAK
jgi:preprotein translocase subunit SecG